MTTGNEVNDPAFWQWYLQALRTTRTMPPAAAGVAIPPPANSNRYLRPVSQNDSIGPASPMPEHGWPFPGGISHQPLIAPRFMPQSPANDNAGPANDNRTALGMTLNSIDPRLFT